MLKKNLINQQTVKTARMSNLTKGIQVKQLLVALLFLACAAFADDKTPPPPASAATQASSSQLLNDKHYVNKDGQIVHSPSKTKSGQAPTGATAQCGDGSYSFSQHHQGTCSHHGGVATWLSN